MLNELKQIYLEIKSWNTKCSDDHILECATRIYNASNINEGKKEKVKPATIKQIAYLKRLKIPVAKDLTSIEASKLISENKQTNEI